MPEESGIPRRIEDRIDRLEQRLDDHFDAIEARVQHLDERLTAHTSNHHSRASQAKNAGATTVAAAALVFLAEVARRLLGF